MQYMTWLTSNHSKVQYFQVIKKTQIRLTLVTYSGYNPDYGLVLVYHQLTICTLDMGTSEAVNQNFNINVIF